MQTSRWIRTEQVVSIASQQLLNGFAAFSIDKSRLQVPLDLEQADAALRQRPRGPREHQPLGSLDVDLDPVRVPFPQQFVEG